MLKKIKLSRIAALVISLASFTISAAALADPPARVARLAHTSGDVSFSPAGDDDWVVAKLNRPLITGDRLWVDAGGRDELQIGNAAIRMGGDTSLTLLNLDDETAQLQVSQGVVIVHVRRLGADEFIEIDTPNLAFSIRKAGDYRIEVDPNDDTTIIDVRAGQGEAFGQREGYTLDAGQSYRFSGTDLRDFENFALPRSDDFDRWSAARDQRMSRSSSARFVSRDMIGYEDLDEHGSWTTVASYGNVWIPSRVAADWTPYHDGHWSWVEPWGWTWVDNAPWGFAVSHYGRWANLGRRWCWVPGPIAARPVYAPALVAFVGGNNFRLSISSGNVGGVAWFPLAPREVYRPAYRVSRDYFANINTSNTTINRTVVTNVYNNINVTNVTNVTYVNRQVPGAVVAVPTNAFVQSQQITRAAVRLRHSDITQQPIVLNAAVAPVRTSLLGAAAVGTRPPAEAQARPIVVRTVPPPLPPRFAARQTALTQNNGRPLDPAALAAIKPATPNQATTPQIRLAPAVRMNEPIRLNPANRQETRIAAPAAPATPVQPLTPAQPVVPPTIRAGQPETEPAIGRPNRLGERLRPQAATPPVPPAAQNPVQKVEPPVAAPPVRTINIGPSPRAAEPPPPLPRTEPAAAPRVEPAAVPPARTQLEPAPRPATGNPETRSEARQRLLGRPAQPALPEMPATVAPPAVRPLPPPASIRQPVAEQPSPPVQRQMPRPEAVPMAAPQRPQRVEPERGAAPNPAAIQPSANPAAEAAQRRRELRGQVQPAEEQVRQREEEGKEGRNRR